jgi:4'-phosphopantetheinyl transferase
MWRPKLSTSELIIFNILLNSVPACPTRFTVQYSRDGSLGTPRPAALRASIRAVKHSKPVIHDSKAVTPSLRKIDSPDFRLDSPLPPIEDAQLWRIDLDAVAEAEPRWRSLLSADERERADRFHFDRDRRHFCAARGLLRIVLGGYLAAEPQDVRFRYSDKGKPELAEPYAGSGVTFNLSHSGGVALIGLTRQRPIGIDVEQLRDDFDTGAIAKRFFSSREQEDLAKLPTEKQHRAFFRCWTLKEAFIKALGEGLSHPLHQFDVSVEPEASVSLVTRPDPSEAQRWQLQVLEASPGYAAAMAVLRR